MGVVARLALVLHVGGGDRDAARFLLGRLVNLVVRHELTPVGLGHHLGQGRRERRLAMVHVTDRAHVHVWLGSLKLLFGHGADTSNKNRSSKIDSTTLRIWS